MQRVCKNMNGFFYTPMARKPSAFTPVTDFQKWFHPAMNRRGVDVADVARAVGKDYPHLWKIAKGDPIKYPTSRRPGYELTKSIGEFLNDVMGALVAAGYESPNEDTPKSNSEATEAVGEITRIPEEAQRHVYNYSKLRPVSQRMIDRMTEDLLEVERGSLGIHEERNKDGNEADRPN